LFERKSLNLKDEDGETIPNIEKYFDIDEHV
jgi:hypothetical protein